MKRHKTLPLIMIVASFSNVYADAADVPPAPPALPFLWQAFSPPQTQSPNGAITADITRVYTSTGTAAAQQLMTDLRAMVEQLIIDSLDTSLYLQGVQPGASGSTPDAVYNIVANHFTEFCAPGTPEATNNPSCSPDLMFQHGDLKLSSVLSGSYLDTNRLAAAQNFVSNLIDPFPNTKFQAGTYPDPKTKKPTAITLTRIQNEAQLRQDLANALVNQALLSVARQPFAEMIARRSKSSSSPQTQMEILEQQACQRFYDTNWQCNMKIAYLTALNKVDSNDTNCSPQSVQPPPAKPDLVGAAMVDMNVQMATNTCLEFERFKQAEVVQSLLAAQIAQNYRQAQFAAGVIAGAQPNLSAVTQQPSSGNNASGVQPPSPTNVPGSTTGGTTGNTTGGTINTPYGPIPNNGGTTGTTGGSTGTTGGTTGGTINTPYGPIPNTGGTPGANTNPSLPGTDNTQPPPTTP